MSALELLKLDFESPDFQLAEAENKWQILRIEGDGDIPVTFIKISAAIRPNSPGNYVFRFILEKYPFTAPYICIWDEVTQLPLSKELRPGGKTETAILVRSDWPTDKPEHKGQHLYAPYERYSLETHKQWPETYKDMCWQEPDTILKPLNDIFYYLNSSAYEGIGINVR
jgi:hypothetical protein